MSLEEVMEDMRLMTGSRPKRVSDKRPEKVKQTLETLFPGTQLHTIRPDDYDVPKGS
ncbi:hypothetical protein DCAR_0933978 [Daucus carota subsp. sativus]|uniref:Uncharacterized protein n=1 Tax=Daucus carota subsp. sativus TaxID=79200 RepID=A0A175YCK1_DAUCS|nr:hypothetical protein DCAR_0933978 [Daucus carota subsp. sativus]